MSQLQIFSVHFQVIKAGKYRRDLRMATVSAASPHPKDILAVLNADIALGTGETIDIVSVSPVGGTGTEGNSVLA